MAKQREKFGKLREKTVQLCLDPSLPAYSRLLLWAIPRFKDGSRLDEIETEWLIEWLGVVSEQSNLEEIQTVQFSNNEAAEAIFNGHPQSVQNAIKVLLEKAIFKRVRNGIKGHASLYVVMPLPEMGSSLELTPNTTNRVKPRVDPISTNGVKSDSKWGQMTPQMGSNANAVTRGADSYPDISRYIIQREPNGAAAEGSAPLVSKNQGEQMQIKLNESCPDPKNENCKGTILSIKDVTENPKPKHPDWLMCNSCHARFDAEGNFVNPFASSISGQ